VTDVGGGTLEGSLAQQLPLPEAGAFRPLRSAHHRARGGDVSRPAAQSRRGGAL